MRRILVILGVLAVLGTVATPAVAADGTLPGGTSLSADITAPADGSFVTAGQPVTLTGTATVGEGVAVKDTSIAYIVDVSGSTGNSALVDCDGDTLNDTILKCEVAAVKSVNAQATTQASPVLDSGIGTFNNSGTVVQNLVAPGPAIDTAANSILTTTGVPGGGTDFGAGMAAANTILAGSAAAEKTVIFLTDGVGNGTPANPADVNVLAFAIGANSTCASNLVGLSDECTEVDNLADLDDLINQAITPTIDSLSYSVDGVPKSFLPGELTPTVPPSVDGPGSVDFDANIGPLTEGSHTICVTANGTDTGGSDSVTDCVDVTSVQATVDCSVTATCEVSATDGNKSTATVVGTGFNKQLGVNPAACSSPEDCVTSYDVLFDDTGDTGAVMEMTVITSVENFVHPSVAEVFIDDVKVTTDCSSTSTLPCKRITKIKNYDHCAAYTHPFWNLICKIFFPKFQTKYVVQFDADPRFRFR